MLLVMKVMIMGSLSVKTKNKTNIVDTNLRQMPFKILVEIMMILTDESFDSGALSDENTGSSWTSG